MIGLGALGDIVFISSMTNPVKVRTFDEFQRSSTDRWGNNEIHLQKPRSQFLGPGLDTISFSMTFDAALGMNPRKEMEKLLEYSRSGKVMPLSIGGKALGAGKWKITGLVQEWSSVDSKGILLRSKLQVTLEEYV